MSTSYTGVVEKGGEYAATLGYPTINIACADAPPGVYAARVEAAPGSFEAAAYKSPTRAVLEAHLLNFDGSLYGQQVSITLVHKIRGDTQFKDEAALKAAIAEDIEAVRNFFNGRNV